MRLTRWEVLILAALLAGVAAQAVLGAQRFTGDTNQFVSPSWKEQERAVQERIQTALPKDRRTLEERIRQNPALSRKVAWIGQVVAVVFLLAGFFFFRAVRRLLSRRPAPKGMAHPPRFVAEIGAALGRPSPPPWGLREMIRAVGVAVVLVFWVAILEKLAFLVLGPSRMDRHVLALGNTLLLDTAALAAIGWVAGRRIQAWPAFSVRRIVRHVRFALVQYLTFLPILLGILLAVAGLLVRLGKAPPPQPVFTLYFSEGRAAVLGWLVVLVTLVGPVAEEVFFRGVLYRWLRARWGMARALLASAFLFALLHGDPVTFAPIAGLGMLFGWVYERTGSLVAPVAIHMVHNAGMLGLASLVKELAALSGN